MVTKLRTKLCTVLATTLLLAAGQANAGLIYAVTGAGGADASLYTLDPGTGAATFVADVVDAAGTRLTHMTGLDFDPTSGTLYGVTDGGFSDTASLVTIDPGTGVATLVGATGVNAIPDISFDNDGDLWGWTEDSDDLISIDKATGLATTIPGGPGSAATGFAIGLDGTAYMKEDEDVHTIDLGTGAGVLLTSLSFTDPALRNALEFDPTDGTLYSIQGEGFGAGAGRSSILSTIDLAGGTATQVGDTGILNISALAVAPMDVPEPTTLALFGLGLAGLGLRRRRA